MSKCPKCGGEMGGVQYEPGSQCAWDGVSEWQCLKMECGARFGRWSGLELLQGQHEGAYGKHRSNCPDYK